MLYREDGTPIGKDDIVAPGQKVQVRCTVRNAYASPGTEQYAMHVKLANTAANPTKGLTPFADASHPLQVNGATVATAPGPNTITGTNGVPVTLTGSSPVTVSYWATISGVSGGAVTLSQELIEDTFQGRKYATVELVAEQSLKGLPNGADPDDPSTWGTPGTDYHYTRLPQPNVNGWNTTPVTVQFFGGDFDSLTVAPTGGDATKVLADRETWTRTDDTAGYEVQISAANSATGEVSSKRSGAIKIDSSAPRLSLDPALGALTIDDRPTDASKVTSGVWRLHRTGSDGVVSAGRAPAQEFALTNGAGAATQTVTGIANGYYVAEDAAGNLSTPLKVGATEPPVATRPPGHATDPDDPNPPAVKPVGPPLHTGDEVPDPTVTEGDDGLKHAVINETISEMIDAAAPPFSGSLDIAAARALIAYRYNLASQASPATLTETTELLDATGAPISAFATTAPGECRIRHVATDAQGNTTTINLTYQLKRDNCPVARPLEPADPSDPAGPQKPGEPLGPDGPIVTRPNGTQAAEVSCLVIEAITHGAMDLSGAEALLRRHYQLTGADGGDVSVVAQWMKNLVTGAQVSVIDLSRPADWLIDYVVCDAAGNTTTMHMTYRLVRSNAPGVVKHPEPGDGSDLLPGDDPLNPRPRPIDPVAPPTVAGDGTHHAVIEDVIHVRAKAGASLSPADARSLMERRYTFTPEGGGVMTERGLSLADSGGAVVTAIDLSRPGSWSITYRVADADGNTVTVHLRYVVTSGSPSVTPSQPDGSGDDSDGSGGTDPDGSGGNPGGTVPGKPLTPSEVTVDEETGLTHSIVEDHVVVGTSDTPMTPAAMADFIERRYAFAADAGAQAGVRALSSDAVTRGEVHLFDASRAPVSAIDRSAPGVWYAYQTVADGFGNTTELRLTYEVRSNSASGSLGDGSEGGSGAGSGSGDGSGAGSGAAGDGDGSGASAKSWSSRIKELPQTGGIFGSCPLHILFVLMMLLVSAYTMMRLRQESIADRREERRREAV